jgi:transcriptional regulator with XRE-family HTH domain
MANAVVLKNGHLRKLREARDLSLRELGALIGERHSTIAYWEETNKFPRSNIVIPLAKALNVSVEELLVPSEEVPQAKPSKKK